MILNRFFDYFILLCIVLNTIALCITWYEQPLIIATVTFALNYVFSGIFLIEATLKIIGLGIKSYFKDKWNRFDFFIVILTIVAEIVAQAGGTQIGSAVTFIRAMRLPRLLKYIKRAKRIRVIF